MDVEQIIREHIDGSLHLSLATVSGNQPWVCEVHFAYDENLNLYFRSLPTRRHSQEIAQNSHVAGDIIKQHELGEIPQGIYFEDTAELLSDENGRQKAFPYFAARLHASEAVLEEAKRADGHQFYQITVAKWYAFGKFGGDTVQKYELVWH